MDSLVKIKYEVLAIASQVEAVATSELPSSTSLDILYLRLEKIKQNLIRKKSTPPRGDIKLAIKLNEELINELCVPRSK